MKKILAILVTLALPILVFSFPELGTQNDIIVMTSSLLGVAGIIAVVVEGLKKLLKYNPEQHLSWLPQLLALIVGMGLSILFWLLNLGIFTITTVWWHVLIIGLLAGGLSNGWYDVGFVRFLLKALWGIEVNK